MVTRKTVYALRALFHLARAGTGKPQLAAEIAASENIPRRFLDSILRQLSNAGLLTSSRGRGGGYSLRSPANQINVASVVRILDGAAFPFPCLNWDNPVRCAECPGPHACAAHTALGVMGNAAQHVLEDMTLADLVQRMERAPTDPQTRSLPIISRSAGIPT
jgi:Rrf2 family protein